MSKFGEYLNQLGFSFLSPVRIYDEAEKIGYGSQATSIIREPRIKANFAHAKLIDNGDLGVLLYLQKSLTTKETLLAVNELVKQHNLGLTESEGYYVIGKATSTV